MVNRSRFNIQELMFGKPIANEDAVHQAISNKVGLAVFASDCLSSVAYATQEILIVLAAAAVMAGTAGAQGIFGYSIPLSLLIVGLLMILTISYRQTIFAYPGGGGAYIVARDNLGDIWAQVAGAALLTDYVLTVAVSISSGMEQVASLFPALQPWRVPMCIAAIMFMAWMNLRGVKESGAFFAVPTYFFIAMMLITLGVGLFRWLVLGNLGMVEGVEPMHVANPETLGLFMLLRAFSSGCAAVTGVEAISNGIQAFKEPKSRNASNTMLVMAAMLGVMFIGTSVIANQIHAVPSEEATVIFQMGEVVLGPFVPLLVAATTLILILAANTAFADFPRLAALQAKDGFLPRQLAQRGGRLVFSWGVFALAVAAITLIVVFQARTTALIPLYAIGVFLSFSLSQGGMVLHWWRSRNLKPGQTAPSKHGVLHHDRNWAFKMVINAVGCVVSIVVIAIFAVTKFASGAWFTVILIPALVYIFLRIHRHYTDVAQVLSTNKTVLEHTPMQIYTVALVDDIHKGTVEMIKFCMALGTPWEAVHFNDDPEKTHKIQVKWRERMGSAEHELRIVDTPYRNISAKIEEYVLNIKSQRPGTILHVVMGQIVMDSWAGRALHSNTSIGIKLRLEQHDDVIVTDVSYPIHSEDTRNAQADAAEAAAPAQSAELPAHAEATPPIAEPHA